MDKVITKESKIGSSACLLIPSILRRDSAYPFNTEDKLTMRIDDNRIVITRATKEEITELTK